MMNIDQFQTRVSEKKKDQEAGKHKCNFAFMHAVKKCAAY